MARIPQIFALPPGVDFAVELISGMESRYGSGAADLAGIDLWVNTSRMRRKLVELLESRTPCVLPRIRTLPELASLPLPGLLPGSSPLEFRLELRQLVAKLMQSDTRFRGGASPFALADSLANLFAEMADEGVTAADLSSLSVEDRSGHWRQSLQFLGIAASLAERPDVTARLRNAADAYVSSWQSNPPSRPFIIAGSTGSRGPVGTLMRALAQTTNGAVILPGFDFEAPPEVWRELAANPNEDHPQSRFASLLRSLELKPEDVVRWTDAQSPAPLRSSVVSLALRPAPVTDQWLTEGSRLGLLRPIAETTTLIEAPTPKAEAGAIALCLREAAQQGRRAALITPDRQLGRRVRAALSRWNILPDDSVGVLLSDTPAGRLVRQIAAVIGRPVTSDSLFAILKHPLVNSQLPRSEHHSRVREFENLVRAEGLLRPLSGFKPKVENGLSAWVQGITSTLRPLEQLSESHLSKYVRSLREATVALCGPQLDTDQDGAALESLFGRMLEAAPAGGTMKSGDFRELLAELMEEVELRDPITPRPDIMIWGTLEARVQSVDLAILGGLSDGIWPKRPSPDPWLNRAMRAEAGLLSPERVIGLSAHDFQQAASAKEVVFSRSARDDQALTVPSRWLNRLTNLLDGLPSREGGAALAAMRARGDEWLELAGKLDRQDLEQPPAPRPAPRPPVSARPASLSVTQIEALIRDPYAIYARHILGLRALRPLVPQPDALARGNAFHLVLERFIKRVADDSSALNRDAFMSVAREVLAEFSDWPQIQMIWELTMDKLAVPLVEDELGRLSDAAPKWFEVPGRAEIAVSGLQHPFTLTGKADRVDLTNSGRARIYDYKSGAIPTKKQRPIFDLQLFFEAIILEAGGFKGVSNLETERAAFIGIGNNPEVHEIDVSKDKVVSVKGSLSQRIKLLHDPDFSFCSRARPKSDSWGGDYDHLARFGEWTDAADASVIEVGNDG